MTGKEQNGVVFRESFRGYQKDDVNRYIAQIHEQFSRENERTQKEIRLLQDRLSEAEANRTALEDAKNQIDALNKKLSSCNEIASQAQQQKTEMAEQLAKLREEKESIASENAALHARLEQLEQHSAECVKTNAENEENAKRYETMSHKIGDIILSAKAEAEEIIAEAKQKAERQLADANRQAAEIKSESIQNTRKLLYEANERIRIQGEQYVSDCSSLLSEINDKIMEMKTSLKDYGNVFLKNSDQILSELQQNISQSNFEVSADKTEEY